MTGSSMSNGMTDTEFPNAIAVRRAAKAEAAAKRHPEKQKRADSPIQRKPRRAR
jgi:hypothetical protein